MTPAPVMPTTNTRRGAPRFQPAFGTVLRLNPGDGGGRPTVGLVWNISQSGVSLLLAEQPVRGAELDAELTTESDSPGLSVAVRVVHIREMPNGDYFVGAQFTRHLGQEELKRFLTPPPPPPPPPEKD